MTALHRLWKRLRYRRDATDRALARVLHGGGKEAMRIVYSRMENPKTAEAGWLLFGVFKVKNGWNRPAREAFARVPDAMLVRYALPEATKALAESDPDRARSFLRSGRKRWTRIAPRLLAARHRDAPDRAGATGLTLAATSAYLGDAECFDFFISRCERELSVVSGDAQKVIVSGDTQKVPEAEALKRRFAEQLRTARALGVDTDHASIRKAALSLPFHGVPGGTRKLVNTLNPDFPFAAATEDPVWFPVSGPLGEPVWSDRLLRVHAHPHEPVHVTARREGPVDFPFPGNVRPLFVNLHIRRPHIDDETLAYLRRFEPVGCHDLYAARLLRGAGVKAFVGKSKPLPKPVLAAIRKGESAANVYALWRKAVAPAMKRTDAMIAEQNARYPFREVSLENLGLDRVPVKNFGPAHPPKTNPIHLLFSFDHRLAEAFPGTLEGIRRHASRPLVVHVFGRGLDAAMFERWAIQFVVSGDAQKGIVSGDAQKGSSVRFVWRDLSGVAGEDIAVKHSRSASWLDNLLAPALLADVEKIVYLDVDVLVRKDIASLFDIELGDAPLAAHVGSSRVSYGADYHNDGTFPKERLAAFRNGFFSDGGTNRSRASGTTIFETFNSGVVMMNLARMRRERAVNKMLALVRVHGRLGDEAALNVYARGRCKPFAREWNLEASQGRPLDLAIAHFSGPLKPWSSDTPLPLADEWLENAANAQKRMPETQA